MNNTKPLTTKPQEELFYCDIEVVFPSIRKCEAICKTRKIKRLCRQYKREYLSMCKVVYSNLRTEYIAMQFLTSRYIKIHRVLLSLLGLWPYETSTFVLACRIFNTIMLSLTVLTQLAVFTTHTFNLITALDVLSLCLLTTLFLVKYITFWVNKNKFKAILDMIDHVWINATKEERAILQRYGDNGIQLMIYFTAYLAVPVAYIVAGYLPAVLDLVLPLNESRPRQLPATIELFVIDQEKYFHLLLFGVTCISVMAAATMFSTETVFAAIVQQSCAFYKLAAYRVDRAMLNDAEGRRRSTAEVHRILASGIQMHNFAIGVTRSIELCFSNLYFYFIAVGIVSASLNIFSVLLTRNFEKILYYVVLVSGLFYYSFYIHLNTQDLMDHATDFFNDIYTALWYNGSPPTKKLILFILRGNFKSRVFMLGGIYIPNFEGYTSVVNMTISYFMVLYSTM